MIHFFFIVWNIFSYKIIDISQASLKICNKSEYNIAKIQSDYFSVWSIEKWTCKIAHVKRQLLNKMTMKVYVFDSIIPIRGIFAINAYYDNHWVEALNFWEKTLTISRLYEYSDSYTPIQEIGWIKYEIQ